MMSKAWSKILNDIQVRRDFTRSPAGLRWRSNTFFIVATTGIALFSDLFLYGLIVPVMPFILHDRIGLPQNEIQPHFSGLLAIYAASSVICSPFVGFLVDKMPTRQAPLLIGLLALLASTLMLFLGQTLAVLYVARSLQGISGGFVWTIGLALIAETVGAGNFGKTIGSIFSFISTGSISSPILGGVLYEKVGYSGVFALGCSIIVVDLIMRVLMIEKKVAVRYEAEVQDDDSSPSQSSHQSRSENGNLTQGDERNTNGESEPLLGQRNDERYKLPDKLPAVARIVPILPCLLDPSLATALLVAFVQALLLGCVDATVPTEGQELFGFNSLQAGLLFLPIGAMDLVFGPVFGWCVDRFGTKVVAVGAYLWLVPVLILLRLPHVGGPDQIALYAVLLGLSGVGLAGINAPSIVEAGLIVDRYNEANPGHFGKAGPYGQLYGLNNMIFSLGLTIGPEFAGSLKIAIGYGNMNLVVAAVCALTALVCFVYLGGPPRFSRKSGS